MYSITGNTQYFWACLNICGFLKLLCFSSWYRFTKIVAINNKVWKITHGNKSWDLWAGIINPAGIYLLKVNNRSTRTRCERCSKLTIKIPERHHWRCSGIIIVNSEHISYLVRVFLLLTLNMQLTCLLLFDTHLLPNREFVFYVLRMINSDQCKFLCLFRFMTSYNKLLRAIYILRNVFFPKRCFRVSTK